MRDDLDVDDRSVLSEVLPDAGAVDRFIDVFHGDDIFDGNRRIVADPQIDDRHLQELLAGVTVLADGRVIDGEKGQRLQVVHPHRMRVAVEEQPVAGLAR
ncbi:MAG: hypothetical protein AW12_00760 [Candidatus Accumulibacter sp. BA-94]|nr:MAG: hypothetical protein AW12_00760 [Candidatus Accumulibacter sp. BA-94]